ncbi:cell surface hyaluronidase-like [Stegostoma tigrinum]|uniref:cell surface hyaluronidase-like n=1 Tax=Stegostoma tigrinum TaxID=3053191 RepID=UPI002870B20C|nr:cell surface hyaluronidase-like [Stegostoma tigrinum]XP_048418631.2 cell surface hyaluronidase-like [Stegostoma tigrinum]
MKTHEKLEAQSAVKEISTSCSSERLPQCRITRAVNLLPSLQKHLLFQNNPPAWQVPLMTLTAEDRLHGKRIFDGRRTPKVFTYHLLLFVVLLLVLPGLLHCDGKSQLSPGKGFKGFDQSIEISPLNMAPEPHDGVANSSDTYPLYKRSARSTTLQKEQESSLLTIYQSMKEMKEMLLPCDTLVEVTNHILKKASGRNLSCDFFQLPTCDQKLNHQLAKINPLKLIKVKIKPQLLYEVLVWLKKLNLLLDVHQAKSFSIVKKLMLNKEQMVFGSPVRCPDKHPSLLPWNPEHDERHKVQIGRGTFLKLESSATVHSIIIEDGGKLVFSDTPRAPITLRARYIVIRNGGELHIGAERCPYTSRATISLVGRSTEGPQVEQFGKKFIGVDRGGVLELHGRRSLSWTLLSRTLYPGGLQYGAYRYDRRRGNRGFNVRVIDPGTARLLRADRFDTHLWANESRRLQEFLRSQPRGRIVAVAVGDSAARRLSMSARNDLRELLGSEQARHLGYRQPWAIVGVIRASKSFVVEDRRLYQPNGSTGMAIARRDFQTYDGTRFTVTAYSEWVHGVPHCGFRVEVSKGVILNLMDNTSSWLPGDQIVIASTDYSMYQAENFNLLPCPECEVNQVKIDGKPRYLHMGEIIDGIDMRAEVGLLSRNIVIKGEMENSCYGQNLCHFFSQDTFGGQIRILRNFASVHLFGVELTNMGQQILGSYPVHFHLAGDVDQKGGYNPPTYVDNVAIHHCFSRCVAIHGTNGLLVKDTIGYDTLGHCFFLEDGVEQRNILYHNLGLLTKPGTILPSDRNAIMCITIRDQVYGNYIPVPSTDCMAVTTFWISNPNNHLINNAAAGAQDVGIWFIFHRAPTGQSVGQYPEGQSEFTPLGVFYNNRVHSNFKAGLFIGSGVKTTESNAEDPREVLTVDFARFRPHQNADPKKPRVPAIIDGLVSFKNNDHGAWARGGDIIFRNSGFSDNGIGLTLASDGTFPTDEGSSLEVTKSIFVGESINVGCNGGQNRYWGKGAHGEYRTLPRNRTFPIRGFQIYDGPVRITHCTFKNYISVHERYSSALAFFMRNSWQISPQNNVSQVKLEWNVNLEVFFGKPGQWFGTNSLDGDQTSIFHDLDGSMTGYPDTFVARADNYLVRHPGCLSVPRWNGVICSGKYAQLYVQAWRPDNLSLLISKDSYPDHPLKLQGVNRGASYQQYQPVVMLEQAYTLRWNGRTPEQIVLYPINFNRGNWIQVGMCYPKKTVFKIMSDIYDRSSGRVHSVKRYKAASSFNILQKNPDKNLYYFDSSAGILFLIVQAKHVRKGHSYCSKHGCERLKILSHVISWESSDCLRKGHPVKQSGEPAHLITLTGRVAAPCRHCGAPQVAITSDPHRVYIKIEIQSQSTGDLQNGRKFSFIKVNDEVFLAEKAGLLFVMVDACSGDILSRQYFDTAHTLQVADSIANYIQETIRERSIALISSRGDLGWALNYVSSAFLRLGAAKPINFFKEGSFAMLGFKSRLKPAWIKIRSQSAGQLAASLQHYVPLKLSEYGCSGKPKENRRDLKLFHDLMSSN